MKPANITNSGFYIILGGRGNIDTKIFPVSGITCINPMAPAYDWTLGLKCDSWQIRDASNLQSQLILTLNFLIISSSGDTLPVFSA